MNNIDKIYDENDSVVGFFSQYIDYLGNVLSGISVDQLNKFVQEIINARERGSAVYFMGNGGSAATASHFANDIAIGTRSYEKPFRAVSLSDNQAVITAIANDVGYEFIFSKQLEILLNNQDLVVVISASGNSANLLKAIDVAKVKGATTIGLCAFDGGELKQSVDIPVHVPTMLGEYGPAEDVHMILDHVIGNYLMRYVEQQC